MSYSDYLEDELLDHWLGASSFSAPATVYVALFTTLPADDGTGGTEVTGGSYARIAVTNNLTEWPASSGGSKGNANTVTFATATASWGTVVGFGLYDAITVGNALGFGSLTTSKLVDNGDTGEFDAGDLTVTLD